MNINKKQNNRKIGSKYEKIAKNYLENNGLKCIEMNYYCRAGEIDGIFLDSDAIVFVEVKYRFNKNSGCAIEAVNYKKQIQISKCAKFYIMEKCLSLNRSFRFDVVAIDKGEILWIKNAFDYAWK